ncbi:MAG: hypothetical protein ACI9N0_003464 [Ilumatobacter sp.]|jgi:hypothetical protein
MLHEFPRLRSQRIGDRIARAVKPRDRDGVGINDGGFSHSANSGNIVIDPPATDDADSEFGESSPDGRLRSTRSPHEPCS